MTLPDVGPLGSLAGWFLAVFVMASVVTLIVLGKLVPGPTHDRALKQIDELTEKLGEQTPLIRETGRFAADMARDMDFLLAFVKDTIRDRLREGRDA